MRRAATPARGSRRARSRRGWARYEGPRPPRMICGARRPQARRLQAARYARAAAQARAAARAPSAVQSTAASSCAEQHGARAGPVGTAGLGAARRRAARATAPARTGPARHSPGTSRRRARSRRELARRSDGGDISTRRMTARGVVAQTKRQRVGPRATTAARGSPARTAPGSRARGPARSRAEDRDEGEEHHERDRRAGYQQRQRAIAPRGSAVATACQSSGTPPTAIAPAPSKPPARIASCAIASSARAGPAAVNTGSSVVFWKPTAARQTASPAAEHTRRSTRPHP